MQQVLSTCDSAIDMFLQVPDGVIIAFASQLIVLAY